MKANYKIVIYTLLLFTQVACSVDPLDKEQYKNEVYLVGAYNRTWAIDAKYVDETFEDFFTVSSSGSLNIDQDARIVVETDNSIVDTYNKKFGGEDKEQHFHAVDESLYEIPSMSNIVIEHKNGISTKVPMFIKTKTLDPDLKYAIPVKIVSATPYDVNSSGQKMLIQLVMYNDYSGSYQDEGTRTDAQGVATKIQRVKVIKATAINKIRYFYGINNESNKMADKRAKTIEITILDEFIEGSTTIKKVAVAGWGDVVITDDGNGTYDTVKKEFKVKYTTQSDGLVYEETLTKEPEKIV